MPRPNLVFVFSDQQRYDTMRCYGNNLFDKPSQRDLIRDLAARIKAWQITTGDEASRPRYRRFSAHEEGRTVSSEGADEAALERYPEFPRYA